MEWSIIALTLVILYAWLVEPARLDISSDRVDIDPAMLKTPVRLLFLSDIHGSFLSAAWTRRRLVGVVLGHASAHPFDAVLLGGDYVDRNPRYLAQAEEVVAALVTLGVPVYAVMGNHDYKVFGGAAEIRERFERLGATVLINQSAVLGGRLEVIGIDDLQNAPGYWVKGQKAAPEEYRGKAKRVGWYRAFDDDNPGLPRVMLVHNPDGVYLPGRLPDLVLAGHTHGGQYAPWAWLTPLVKSFLNPKGSFGTWAGRRLVEGRNLIVSRGFGGSWLPARLGRRPQAHDILLAPADYPKGVVIGIAGKPRSGKDTVAAMVQALLPGIARSDFSYVIREEFDAAFGTNIRHDEAEKERLRAKITAFVTEKRAQDEDYWIKKVVTKEPPLVIPSVRYEREIDAIRKAGGVVVLVKSEHASLRKRMRHGFEEQMRLSTEVALDGFTGWDYVIINDGTLLDLERRVREVVGDICRRSKK